MLSEFSSTPLTVIAVSDGPYNQAARIARKGGRGVATVRVRDIDLLVGVRELDHPKLGAYRWQIATRADLHDEILLVDALRAIRECEDRWIDELFQAHGAFRGRRLATDDSNDDAIAWYSASVVQKDSKITSLWVVT